MQGWLGMGMMCEVQRTSALLCGQALEKWCMDIVRNCDTDCEEKRRITKQVGRSSEYEWVFNLSFSIFRCHAQVTIADPGDNNKPKASNLTVS